MNTRFYIDEELCVSCGICVKECGRHVQIQNCSHVEPDHPGCMASSEAKRNDQPECSSCLHCYTVCPKNAIKLKNVDERTVLDPELQHSITEGGLSSFLASRRSIRCYQKRSIDEGILEKLIDRARYIPSGGNAHSYEFTVLKSDEIKIRIKEELNEIYKFRDRLLNNPVLRNAAKPFVNKQMREFLGSKIYRSRMKELLIRLSEGDDPFFHNAPLIIIIHSKDQIPTPKEDAILAGYNICMIAQTLGLGTCFVTLAQNAFNSSRKCKKILNLTPEDNVYAVVTLGYPAVHHQRIAPKPAKQIHLI